MRRAIHRSPKVNEVEQGDRPPQMAMSAIWKQGNVRKLLALETQMISVLIFDFDDLVDRFTCTERMTNMVRQPRTLGNDFVERALSHLRAKHHVIENVWLTQSFFYRFSEMWLCWNNSNLPKSQNQVNFMENGTR